MVRSFIGMCHQSYSLSVSQSLQISSISIVSLLHLLSSAWALLVHLFIYAFAFSPAAASSLLKFKLTLLTQCLSSVGVSYPSPLNTCPKCPPQFVQTISVLSIPNVRSVWRVTEPSMASKYAGQPQPDLNLWWACVIDVSERTLGGRRRDERTL